MTHARENQPPAETGGRVFVARETELGVLRTSLERSLSGRGGISETIARIAGVHPALGRHLENVIRTGIFCSHEPDRSPDWSL